MTPSLASLAKQRNSCYSGKRTWNDSPATSVITTPPVTNKLFQSYYSILGKHCLYDILPDIIWDMETHSARCATHMCFVTKSLYIGPLQILKVTLKGIFSKQEFIVVKSLLYFPTCLAAYFTEHIQVVFVITILCHLFHLAHACADFKQVLHTEKYKHHYWIRLGTMLLNFSKNIVWL